MKISKRPRWLAAAVVVAATAGVLAAVVPGGANAAPVARAASQNSGSATGLGQLSGLLPRNHLTWKARSRSNLSNETVRLPIYPGDAPTRAPGRRRGCGTSCWTPPTPASRTTWASTTRRSWPTSGSAARPRADGHARTTRRRRRIRSGPAVIHFQGAPDFSPTRIAVPGPNGFPLAKFQPGAVAGPGYSPFIRIAGLGRGLQRADHRHRRRPVRRHPPHQHRRPGAGRPHRGPVRARPVRGVVGRHAVRQGLRRRPADRLPEHRRRAAADRGARALHLRSGARQRVVQRRR